MNPSLVHVNQQACSGYPIRFYKFAIGRGKYNDLIISDPTVSRVHCILEKVEAQWTILCKSENGTYLNGRLLDKFIPHAIVSGDRIVIANRCHKFKFLVPTNGVSPAENTATKPNEEEIIVISDNEETESDRTN